MSRDLPPRAVERLLDAAAPLGERPELGAIDHERYEPGEELGRGGMGVVYAAWDRELERPVALKILSRPAGLSEDARKRFLREARAAARLVHPHIATVYDATPEAIAMQRIHGRTLGEREDRDPRTLAALVRDAALAIHFAHGEGIVHRDLKPANLMVDETGERPHVYVMDFGLAKERAVDSSLSISGTIVGTPGFLAPEQAAGAPVEPTADVYGLGATLYACLAGRPPFEDDDLYRLLRRVVEDEPEPLQGVAPRTDRDLSLIVARCMEKEPARRYPSALALASDLDRWLRGEPMQARPPSLGYRLRRFVSRRQGVLVAAAVAAGVVLLVSLPFVVRARSRRASAENERALAERVFALSQSVSDALRDARATRDSGLGHERRAHTILQEAIDECRAFLDRTEIGYACFFLGLLYRERGWLEEALAAFDRAEELQPEIDEVFRERGLVLAGLYRDGYPVLGGAPPPALEGWRERGAADLGRALARPPEMPTAEWLHADAQLDWLRGDVAAAIDGHREVVEMDVGHQDAHLALSRLYLIVDREELAMRHSVLASDLLRGYRPAYVGGAGVRSSSGESLLPERELLPLEGMRELLVDFNLLLQLAPGDLPTYGLRAQVQTRQALRALSKGARLEAQAHLTLAIRELDSALMLRDDHASALVNRAVCRKQLSELLSASGESFLAATELASALSDYDAALAAAPDLAVARFDRALLHQRRARLAQLVMSPAAAREALRLARDDAGAALDLSLADHPWRWRFQALAEELE